MVDIPIMSDPLFVNAVQGLALEAGSTNMIASFSQSTNTEQNTWQAHHMMRLNFYNTRINDDQSGTDYTNITTNIGVGVDGTSSQLATMQEHIALNPAGYRNGISLCSYTVCGLNVDRDGLTWHTQDVHVTGGKAVFLGDENKKDVGYFFGRLNPSSGAPDLHIVVRQMIKVPDWLFSRVLQVSVEPHRSHPCPCAARPILKKELSSQKGRLT